MPFEKLFVLGFLHFIPLQVRTSPDPADREHPRGPNRKPETRSYDLPIPSSPTRHLRAAKNIGKAMTPRTPRLETASEQRERSIPPLRRSSVSRCSPGALDV